MAEAMARQGCGSKLSTGSVLTGRSRAPSRSSLYRTAQEALANVRRHSTARTAKMTFGGATATSWHGHALGRARGRSTTVGRVPPRPLVRDRERARAPRDARPSGPCTTARSTSVRVRSAGTGCGCGTRSVPDQLASSPACPSPCARRWSTTRPWCVPGFAMILVRRRTTSRSSARPPTARRRWPRPPPSCGRTSC